MRSGFSIPASLSKPKQIPSTPRSHLTNKFGQVVSRSFASNLSTYDHCPPIPRVQIVKSTKGAASNTFSPLQSISDGKRNFTSDSNTPDWLQKIGSTPATHPDFDIINSEIVEEYQSRVTLYRHRATGARMVSMVNSDEEKTFSIGFRTPPPNDTGVPHILEHSVLAGSEKYPLKEPFAVLMRSSLQTYLNAMTFPDRTEYPVASPNLADFHNLVDVYLDAVLHPLLRDVVFRQEGWRMYEDVGPNGEKSLTYSGVVFNEMKGVISNVDPVQYDAIYSLLHDQGHPYGNYSGGDPLAIPSLTYEDFKNFHATHYHPSNAYLFFYGDDPESDRLSKISAAFASFSKAGNPAPILPLQPPRSAVVASMPVVSAEGDGSESAETSGTSERDENGGELPFLPPSTKVASEHSGLRVHSSADPWKPLSPEFVSQQRDVPHHAITLTWLLHPHPEDTPRQKSPVGDDAQPPRQISPEDTLGVQMLYHLLAGSPSSPLVEALQSELNGSFTGLGVDFSVLRPTFSVGMMSLRPADLPRVPEIVRSVLEHHAKEGFDPALAEAALNGFEYSQREFTAAATARGIAFASALSSPLLFGEDPFEALRGLQRLRETRQRLRKEPQYFQKLIRKYLLQNDHIAVLHTYPEPRLLAQRQDLEARRLRWLDERTSPEERRALDEQAERLRAFQESIDSPDDLAKIPSLSPKDLPPSDRPISLALSGLCDTQPKSVALTSTADATQGSDSRLLHLPSLSSLSDMPPSSLAGPRSPTLLLQEAPTAGIFSMSFHVDLSGLPPRLLPLLPLFSQLLSHASTSQLSRQDVTVLTETYTGHLSVSHDVEPLPGHPDRASAFLTLSLRALATNAERAVQLLLMVLEEGRLDDRDRIRQLVGETVTALSAAPSSSGHSTASQALAATASLPGWLKGLSSGSPALLLAKALQKSNILEQAASTTAASPYSISGDLSFEALVVDLEEIRQYLFSSLHAHVFSSSERGHDVHEQEPLAQDSPALVSISADAASMQTAVAAAQALYFSLLASRHAVPALLAGAAANDAPGLFMNHTSWRSAGLVGSCSSTPTLALTVAGAELPLGAFSSLRALTFVGPGATTASGTGTTPRGVEKAAEMGENFQVASDGRAQALAITVPAQVNFVVKSGPVFTAPRGEARGLPQRAKQLGLRSALLASARSDAVLDSESLAHTTEWLRSQPQLFQSGLHCSGSDTVCASLLSSSYLWEMVRVRGGAYGAGVGLNPHSGNATFYSYRDPNILKTLDAYAGASGFLRDFAARLRAGGSEAQLARNELDKAIVSAVGSIDAPLSLFAKEDVGVARYVRGTTQQMLQESRDQLFSTSADDFEQLAEGLERLDEKGSVAIVGAPANFQNAAEEGCKLEFEFLAPTSNN